MINKGGGSAGKGGGCSAEEPAVYLLLLESCVRKNQRAESTMVNPWDSVEPDMVLKFDKPTDGEPFARGRCLNLRKS